MARLTRTRLLIVGIGGVAYATDQITKHLAVTHLDPKQPIPVLGDLLRLQLIFNPGAAFSLAEDFTVVLTVLAMLALVFVIVWLAPRVRHTGWAVATGLLLCGIGGNLTDRLVRPPGPFHGHVIDFLQLPYWPIFNVADMCLVFAMGILVFLTVVRPVSWDGSHPDAKRDSGAAATEVEQAAQDEG